MVKWADYIITKVRYSTDKKHIEKVKISEDHGEDKLAEPSEFTRQAVVNLLEGKKEIVTAYLENGSYKKGAKVDIVTVKGIKYIRTDETKIEKDNLERLPEF